MQDVSGGVERLRAWPSKRKKRRSSAERAREERFRGAQDATKFMAPEMYASAVEAVKGTPLLPRDILTSMLYGRLCIFVTNDGRTLYPMSNAIGTSEALDTLTQTPGQSIIRGPNGWIEYTPATEGANVWQVLADVTLSGSVANWTSATFAGFSEVQLLLITITAAANGNRALQVSQDGGATWLSAAASYVRIEAAGTTVNGDALNLHDTASAGARTAFAALTLAPTGPGTNVMLPARAAVAYISGLTGMVNRVRIINRPSGNLTGGRIIMLAR